MRSDNGWPLPERLEHHMGHVLAVQGKCLELMSGPAFPP
jgi:hypothetical protein